jgi:hypothetical protein
MQILSIIKHFLTDATQQVKFNGYVGKFTNLERNHSLFLKNVNEIYELFPDKTNITRAEYGTYLLSKFPSGDHTDQLDVYDSAMSQDVGTEISLKLLEDLVERQCAVKAMAASQAIVSNQKTGDWYNKTEEVLQEYRELVSSADKPDQLQDCDLSFEDAIIFRATDSGIKWPLSILTKCIGGVEPSLGLVIARPDIGKTSFIMNCLAYFAHQLMGTDHQLLYCGNEEGIIGLKARMGVSLLGVDTEWAEQNPKQFGEQVARKNGNCVRFHGGVKSTRDVETLVKRYNPMVTVLDQLPKFIIPGNKVEGPAGLALVYQWFRDKAKELDTMMMGVCQAAASAHNKQWLTDMDINASKTDVPGELDWGIGIGFLTEQGMELQRFINIFKNKQKYGRKGRDEVMFFAEKCRYKDM